MGCCFSTNSKNVIKSKDIKTLSNKTGRESDEKYKDMEEWEGTYILTQVIDIPVME
jgi:hypothetical protein